MITARAFAGKHYAVLGLARSGLATVEALIASGAKVTAWDDKLLPGEGRDPGQREPLLRTGLGPGLRRGAEIEDFVDSDLTQFDSIVVTPGLPLNRHPIASRAREAGVEIIGDIELFARARAELPLHKVVGITGTNGKSTTTALVHHILQTAGVPSLMGGNIGLPILSRDPLPEGGVYVLELSSYQIDLTKTLDCDVAVLLNITPDHLDRYESFDAYAASKYRLFEMQRGGLAIALAKPLFEFGTLDGPGTIALIDDVLDHKFPQLLDRRQFLALQGPHNHDNMLAAIETCAALGLVAEQIRNGLVTFAGLPHRMERIRELSGVAFVNDSKATNTDAVTPALAAFEKIRWIVGGRAKDNSLGGTERHLRRVVAAYTIGEAGPMFARLLRDAGVSVIECETLENAVKRAAEDSQAGETVLLSPASASFDQYRDFEARGDHFRLLVGAL